MKRGENTYTCRNQCATEWKSFSKFLFLVSFFSFSMNTSEQLIFPPTLFFFSSCGDMFENGSYLRRRKRFKSMKRIQSNHSPSASSRKKKTTAKNSFLIDNLLANDTSTNVSSTSSSSSTALTTTSPIQQLFDLELVRQYTYQQQICWSNWEREREEGP